ncbi:SpoIVB peptidase S55 domain-containing protein [Lysinibacillus sp. 54212]|uniref:SpoIVB peptidase S55 domain-containing protein n=1 Tax=Lysinibacillus sp. 54212 TaxID=3119829 RepID=UPI002FC5F8EB
MNGYLRNLLIVFVLLLCAFPTNAEAKKLIPMGHSVNIQLQMPFVFVTNDVLLDNGQWLKKGDKLLKMNKEKLHSIDELKNIDDSSVEMTFERAKKRHKLKLTKDELNQLSPFLKNETDGIGTLTYIDPDDLQYGALGHQIIDHSLNIAPEVAKGSLFLATITQIKKSSPGEPGYKISKEPTEEAKLGSVVTNDVYGIFGKWQQPIQKSLQQPLEIIPSDDIQSGKAQLFTSIEGSEVEAFDIRIEKKSGSTFQFSVTDERLLDKTGGIIQGMSGSPIIQDNRFIGAVTHMYVEQPTKGAAITIVEMIKKSPE